MEKGLEAICGDSIIPPETDNYDEDVNRYDDRASFRYSALEDSFRRTKSSLKKALQLSEQSLQ